MVGRPQKARHNPARTSSSATTKDRKPHEVKHIIDRPVSATGLLRSEGHSLPSRHCSTTSSIHTSTVITIEDRGEEDSVAQGDATRKANNGFVSGSVNHSSSTGRADTSPSHRQTAHPAEAVAEEVSNHSPPISGAPSRAFTTTSGSRLPTRKERGGSRESFKSCHTIKQRQHEVTYLSDEEKNEEIQLDNERLTPPQSPTPVRSSRGSTGFSPAHEPVISSRLLCKEENKEEVDEVGEGMEQPRELQRGGARAVHNHSVLRTSSPTRVSASPALLGATATEDSKRHASGEDQVPLDMVSRAFHTAPLLHASGLIDFFTYGIQAAARHYCGHLNGSTSAEENGARDEMSEAAAAGIPDQETASPALAASPDNVPHHSTPPRYRNIFLEDNASVPRNGVNQVRYFDKTDSRSSSAATYDSGAEGDESLSFQNDKKSLNTRETCLLNPQQTSLFRGPRGAIAAHHPAQRGTTIDESWLAATEETPPSTNSRQPSRVPCGAEQSAKEPHGVCAQALFREALQHAYQCEDAHRHLRRAQLDKQRVQLLRGVALLQGGPSPSCAALLRELQPAHVRDNHRCTHPTTPLTSLKPQQRRAGGSAKNQTVEVVVEQTSKVQKATPALVQENVGGEKNGTDNLFAALDDREGCASVSAGTSEACISCSPMSVTTPQMGSMPQHFLQVMSPAQAKRLHRPLNPFTEALVRHHRDWALKQRAARNAEDQAIHARRIYELPLLTEDVVRYASLLLCLRRRGRGGGGTVILSGTQNTGDAAVLPPGPTTKELSSSSSNGGSPQSPAVTTADNTTPPPFGEEGTLLYLKYPAPLLRTTSFAVETVRLMKWLRTWKKSSLGAPTGTAGILSSAGSGDGGSTNRNRDRNTHKRVRGEAPELHRLYVGGNSGPDDNSTYNDEAVQVVANSAAPASCTLSCTTTAEASQSNRSTVERICCQVQHAAALHQAELKQERRLAFLKLFGAAAAGSPMGTLFPSTYTQSKTIAVHEQIDEKFEAGEAEVQQHVSSVEAEELTGTTAGARNASTTPVGVTHGITSSLGCMSLSAGQTQLKSSQTMRCSRAYQLYCQAWKHVVRVGITPLAVATKAFSANRAIPGQPWLSKPHASNSTGASVICDTEMSWTCGTVSRACADLPFFKEMREEARRTALGSVSNGSLYEDAFGNRLRSARLAKKEREQQELLAAQQRRRAKRRGYFHRDDGNSDGFSGKGANRASGMLEVVLQSFATSGNGSQDTGGRKKRRRSDDSSDSTSEGDTSVKSTAPHSSKECAAVSCPSSSQSSSRSSSESMVSSESDEDGFMPKDELTNIAVVSGPTGSGKTAAVYVAAQLLGFRVVEMNTSVRRCSKTVEHLLAELTRSYRLSGTRTGSTGGFNVEEELARLKQQHADMMQRAKDEAVAAEKESPSSKRGAAKTNSISAHAIAKFFAKGSNRPAEPSNKIVNGTRKNDVVEQAPSVCIVDDTHLSADISAASPPTPPQQPPPAPATPGAPVGGTETLLLFEDADILLGDESAKSFYAAIRDLAHRSKVPIVVTVSSDPVPAQRYDTEPFLDLHHHQQQQQQHSASTSREPALQSTYWQLCDKAGINSTMASLDAEQHALHLETDLSLCGAFAATVTSTSAATRESGGSLLASGDNGRNGGVSLASGTSAAVLSSPVSYASSGGAGGSAATATSPGTNGMTTGVSHAHTHGSSGNNTTATTTTTTTAASVAARYTHMPLNATLVSNYFGSQTPFTVVGPLPPSALYAQLLAVGAVELDLLRLSDRVTLPDDSDGATAVSWQHELEDMVTHLKVHDVDLFLRLAEQLRHHIFGAWDVVKDTTSASPTPSLLARHSLVTAVQCDAARTTTTDIRYWLNTLQVLLPSLRVVSSAAQVLEGDRRVLTDSATRKRSREAVNETSSAAVLAACRGDIETCDTHFISARRAEHLLEADFKRGVSRAASEWDSAHGRHLSNVSYNELHSTRYQHWFLDSHVNYITDIVEELTTTDHPTARVDYTTPPKAAASSVAAAKPGRRGPSSISSPSENRPPCAKQSNLKTGAIPDLSQHRREETLRRVTEDNDSNSSGCVSSGMHSAWRSFFGAAGTNQATAFPAKTSRMVHNALPESSRQRTFWGRGDTKASRTALDASPQPPLVIPSRYEWPPSVREIRQQTQSQAHMRPVELVLPYGAAETYYNTTATSTSTLALLSIHEQAEQTSVLLGHEAPLRFPMRRTRRDPSAGDSVEEGEVSRDLPVGVLSTQEERFSVFRRWWCRTRKAGVLRDSVAGRSVGALEDLVGFGCLLTPSAAATRTSTV